MNFSFFIENWYALSSGLANKADWRRWANNVTHDWTLPLPKPTRLPMMQARRMSVPSRLAVEVGLELINETEIDFVIFVSRHGELERTYKILASLNQNIAISPTDFALSVHNTASGLLTIIAKRDIPTTTISAHQDGFLQGLIEAQSLLNQGNNRILLIDFDGVIPQIYQKQISPLVPAYAVGFLLTNSNTTNAKTTNTKVINVETTDNDSTYHQTNYQTDYPQSLAFLHGYLNKQKTFTLQGNRQNWRWTIND